MLNWYAVRSKPNKETALWREFCIRGMECFYPQLHVHPVNPRSRTIRPYFPGYLFLHADLEQVGFSAIQWMPFSMGLVSFNGIPAAVPENLVCAVRHRVDEIEAAGGEIFKGLRQGDPVIIQNGVFGGYEAIFDARLSGSERVRVLLLLMNKQQVPLELRAGQIQRKNRR